MITAIQSASTIEHQVMTDVTAKVTRSRNPVRNTFTPVHVKRPPQYLTWPVLNVTKSAASASALNGSTSSGSSVW